MKGRNDKGIVLRKQSVEWLSELILLTHLNRIYFIKLKRIHSNKHRKQEKSTFIKLTPL